MSVTNPTGPGPARLRLPGPAWLALPLFALLLALGMRTHELWRDETQAWAVARESVSLAKLLGANLRYEGHPPLWYLLLYPVTRLTHDPVGMQWLHAGLALACVALLLWRAPFARGTRALLALGYFPLYEWGVLSRNYAVGLLALLVALSLWPRWRERLIPLAVALVLMALANAYALLVAGALAGTLLFEAWRERRAGAPWPGTPGQRVAALLLVGAGFALSAAYLLPPPDRWSGQETTADARHLVGALAAFWNGCVPLPEVGNYNFWNTNIVTLGSWKWTTLLRAVLGVALWAVAAWQVRRRPAALAFLLLGTGTLFLFTWLRWPGYLRHHGHFFVVLLGAFWLAAPGAGLHARGGSTSGGGAAAAPVRVGAGLLLLLALAQAVAGGWALAMDIRYPFSDSRATADYIRGGRLNALPIVGTRDCIVSPLATYLDRSIYYPEFGGWGRSWTARYRSRYFDPAFALEAARAMADERHGPVLFILSRPMEPGLRGPAVRDVATFDRSFLRFDSGLSRLEPEHFYLYEILPAPIEADPTVQ